MFSLHSHKNLTWKFSFSAANERAENSALHTFSLHAIESGNSKNWFVFCIFFFHLPPLAHLRHLRIMMNDKRYRNGFPNNGEIISCRYRRDSQIRYFKIVFYYNVAYYTIGFAYDDEIVVREYVRHHEPIYWHRDVRQLFGYDKLDSFMRHTSKKRLLNIPINDE